MFIEGVEGGSITQQAPDETKDSRVNILPTGSYSLHFLSALIRPVLIEVTWSIKSSWQVKFLLLTEDICKHWDNRNGNKQQQNLTPTPKGRKSSKKRWSWCCVCGSLLSISLPSLPVAHCRLHSIKPRLWTAAAADLPSSLISCLACLSKYCIDLFGQKKTYVGDTLRDQDRAGRN